MTAFAQVTDVSGTWRTLTTAQTTYAAMLLDAAALWIRNRKPSVAADDPAAKIVSIDVVRSRLQQDLFGGTTAGTHTVGNRTDSWITARTATVADLAKTLVFTDYHYELLGLAAAHTPRGLFGDRYPGPDPIRLRGNYPGGG